MPRKTNKKKKRNKPSKKKSLRFLHIYRQCHYTVTFFFITNKTLANPLPHQSRTELHSKIQIDLSLSHSTKKKIPNTAATKNRERFKRYRIMRFGKLTRNRRFRWARTRNSTNSGETKREMDRNGAEAEKRCRFLEEWELLSCCRQRTLRRLGLLDLVGDGLGLLLGDRRKLEQARLMRWKKESAVRISDEMRKREVRVSTNRREKKLLRYYMSMLQ